MKIFGTKQKSKLRRKGKPLPSIETNGENSALSLSPAPSQSVNTFHLSASTLPLARFIDVYCDNRLEALIIQGTVSPIELLDAWDTILNEYIMIIGSAKTQHLILLQRHIAVLECKIKTVDTCIEALWGMAKEFNQRSDIAVSELGRIGYRFPFNIKDPESFQKNIDAVYSRSKTLVVELDMKQKEFERVNKNVSSGITTRTDFDAEIITLSKWQGYQIDEEKTTLSKYAHIYKSFVQYVEKQNGGKDR